MNIRPAVAADIAALAQVATAAYRQAFAEILEPEALASRDASFFSGLYTRQLAKLILAEADGRIDGFAMTTGTHLDMLFVAPGAQAKGIGSALLAEVEIRGVRTLECFRDNIAARDFYERHGWRLTRAYRRGFIGRERDFVFYEVGRPDKRPGNFAPPAPASQIGDAG